MEIANDQGMHLDRIPVDPAKRGGNSCIQIARRVLDIPPTYPERDQHFREYPFLDEDLPQALSYAATAVDDEVHDFDRVA